MKKSNLPLKGGAKFCVREYVRWGDVDKAGIICYGAYVRFFEIAETEFFRAAGYPYAILFDRFNIWLPRVQLHFEFRNPAVLDDLLKVEVAVGRIGQSSIRLEFTVRKACDVLTADGYLVMVAVDRERFRPVPLPEELVAALGPFRTDATRALTDGGTSNAS